MTSELVDRTDPRVISAIAELQGIIKSRYPDATFDLSDGEDPEGLSLTANVDVENMWDVIDIVSDRLTEIQIDDDLPIFLLIGLPAYRVEERLRAAKSYSAEGKSK